MLGKEDVRDLKKTVQLGQGSDNRQNIILVMTVWSILFFHCVVIGYANSYCSKIVQRL